MTLVDVSPTACGPRGVQITTRVGDLTRDPLPDGPWQVVLFHHYLDRAALAHAAGALAAGGVLLVCQPTVRNLERHARPPRRWLLAEGEAGRLALSLRESDPGLRRVQAVEGWTSEGRHEAHLVLRRVTEGER